MAMASRMVSRSRLGIAASPSRQRPVCLRQRRRSLGGHQVDDVDYEGGVDQKRYGQARQPPATQLDGIRQGSAVEQDEQPRVDEHHEPAPRRGEDQQYERLDARPYDQ